LPHNLQETISEDGASSLEVDNCLGAAVWTESDAKAKAEHDGIKQHNGLFNTKRALYDPAAAVPAKLVLEYFPDNDFTVCTGVKDAINRPVFDTELISDVDAGHCIGTIDVKSPLSTASR